MTSPHERLRLLREEEARVRADMAKVQREIDARTPIFELHGRTKESSENDNFGDDPHRIGLFSTFEKALDMQAILEKEGGSKFYIRAVRKDEVNFDGNNHHIRVFEVDGPIDELGYLSD